MTEVQSTEGSLMSNHALFWVIAVSVAILAAIEVIKLIKAA